MSKTKKLQLLFISSAMLLFVALLFANTTPPQKAHAEETHNHSKVDLKLLVENEKKALNAQVQESIKLADMSS